MPQSSPDRVPDVLGECKGYLPWAGHLQAYTAYNTLGSGADNYLDSSPILAWTSLATARAHNCVSPER